MRNGAHHRKRGHVDQAIEQVRADYDSVPYESHAFPQTAPGHLAAVTHLFGLDPPDVACARVLEIGCSAGGNVIPFAAWHPACHAVGLDLSAVQIDQGRRRIRALGLTNIELLQGDIASMDLAPLGTFDYIICHGVYSWVPENVQRAILSAFKRLLTPNGVAYISYNVYPGWKSKEIVRDAMLLRGGGMGTPQQKLSYARGMIDFLEEVAPADSILAKALSEHRALTANARDYYLLHEYLESFNTPCYFLKLASRVGEHGLVYLADAAPSTMFAVNYGDKIATPLLAECGHSQGLVEQYLDFVVNRTFRQSLLVHGEWGPRIQYKLDRTRFAGFHFAARTPSTGDPTRLDDSPQEYGEPGATIGTNDPGVKAALEVLAARWPWTISRRDLLDAVRERLDAAGVEPAADQQDRIDELLEQLIIRGLGRYRLEPMSADPPFTPLRLSEPGRRMAKAARADKHAYVVNPWHEEILLSAVDRHLLPLLDGTRDRDALVDTLLTSVRAGLLWFERDGRRLTGNAELRDAIAEHVDALSGRLIAMKLSGAGVSE